MRSIHEDDMNPRFMDFLKSRGVLDHPGLSGHVPRYMHSLRHMPHGSFLRGGDYSKALEIGTNFIFPELLMNDMGFESVDVTQFNPSATEKKRTIPLPRDPKKRTVTSFNVDLEYEPIPADDGTYDLVLCFEVIEHMEIDPMYLIENINRVLRPDGLCFLSTPNSASARNVHKILRGYAPHFFMKYGRARTYHRHNFEYAPHQLIDLMKSAGFSIRKLWTCDTLEGSIPGVLDFLAENGFVTDHRGDNLFVIGQKTGPVLDRHPSSIYS